MDEKTRRTGTLVKGDGSSCRFYMLEPKEGSDAKATAMELMAFREVQEVYVTEGSHGFIVKVRGREGKDLEAVRSYIASKTGSRFGQATARFGYRK